MLSVSKIEQKPDIENFIKACLKGLEKEEPRFLFDKIIRQKLNSPEISWADLKVFLQIQLPHVWAVWPKFWRQLQIDRLEIFEVIEYFNSFFENEDFVFCFSSLPKLEAYREFIHLLLGISEPENFKAKLIFKGLYYFKLTPEEYSSILKMISEKNDQEVKPSDKFIKTVRADKNDFWRDFIKHITQTPNNRIAHQYRPAKEGYFYTLSSDGIFKVSEKPERFLARQLALKPFLSAPQSVSLLTKNKIPTYFGHSTLRKEKLVGIMISAQEALANRYMMYDGGTNRALWRDAYIQDLCERSSLLENLYSDLSSFKERIENDKTNSYNEVLARIQFSLTTSQLVIFSNNLASRCLAQERARSLKKQLQLRAALLGEVWDENYQVPIVFYPKAPDTNFQTYTKEQQLEDKKLSNQLYEEANKNGFLPEHLDFLYLIDDLDKIFTQVKILKKLIQEENLPLFYNLIDRAADLNFDLYTNFSYLFPYIEYLTKRSYDEHLKYLAGQFQENASSRDRIKFFVHIFRQSPFLLENIYTEEFCSNELEKKLIYIIRPSQAESSEILNKVYCDILTDQKIFTKLCEYPELIKTFFNSLLCSDLPDSTLKLFLAKDICQHNVWYFSSYLEQYIDAEQSELLRRSFSNGLNKDSETFIIQTIIKKDKTHLFEQDLGIDVFSAQNYRKCLHYNFVHNLNKDVPDSSILNEHLFSKKLFESPLFDFKAFMTLVKDIKDSIKLSEANFSVFKTYIKNNFKEFIHANIAVNYTIFRFELSKILFEVFVEYYLQDPDYFDQELAVFLFLNSSDALIIKLLTQPEFKLFFQKHSAELRNELMHAFYLRMHLTKTILFSKAKIFDFEKDSELLYFILDYVEKEDKEECYLNSYETQYFLRFVDEDYLKQKIDLNNSKLMNAIIANTNMLTLLKILDTYNIQDLQLTEQNRNELFHRLLISENNQAIRTSLLLKIVSSYSEAKIDSLQRIYEKRIALKLELLILLCKAFPKKESYYAKILFKTVEHFDMWQICLDHMKSYEMDIHIKDSYAQTFGAFYIYNKISRNNDLSPELVENYNFFFVGHEGKNLLEWMLDVTTENQFRIFLALKPKEFWVENRYYVVLAINNLLGLAYNRIQPNHLNLLLEYCPGYDFYQANDNNVVYGFQYFLSKIKSGAYIPADIINNYNFNYRDKSNNTILVFMATELSEKEFQQFLNLKSKEYWLHNQNLIITSILQLFDEKSAEAYIDILLAYCPDYDVLYETGISDSHFLQKIFLSGDINILEHSLSHLNCSNYVEFILSMGAKKLFKDFIDFWQLFEDYMNSALMFNSFKAFLYTTCLKIYCSQQEQLSKTQSFTGLRQRFFGHSIKAEITIAEDLIKFLKGEITSLYIADRPSKGTALGCLINSLENHGLLRIKPYSPNRFTCLP